MSISKSYLGTSLGWPTYSLTNRGCAIDRVDDGLALRAPGHMILFLRSYPAIFALWIVGDLLAIGGAPFMGELAASIRSKTALRPTP